MGLSSRLFPQSGRAKRDGALLLLVALVIFWKLILTGQYTMLWAGDNAVEAYPWYHYIVVSLHEHSFPFWNPYSEAGRLFIGEPTSGAFYPFNLLLALIPLNSRGLTPAWGLEYSIIIHFFLASLLTYMLARHLGFRRFSAIVSGIVFAYSGSLALRYWMHESIFAASVWIPGVFLFFSKALRADSFTNQLLFSNLGGGMLALSILAGHHQPFLYCSTAIGITAVCMAFNSRMSLYEAPQHDKTRGLLLRTTVLLFTFAIMYSCLQLFTTLQYSQYTYRWAGTPVPIRGNQDVPYSVAGTLYALQPKDLFVTIFPFLGYPEANPYFGILALLFVLFSLTLLKKSRLVRLLWLLAAIFLLAALANYTPVHGILYFLLPGFGKAREASRSILITHFSFALLAGLGCEAFLGPFSKRERPLKTRLIYCFTACGVAMTVITFVIYLYATLILHSDTGAFDQIFVSCFLLLMTSALAIARLYSRIPKRALQGAILAVLVLDYHAVVASTIKPKDSFRLGSIFEPMQYYRIDNVIQYLRSQPGIFRVKLDRPYSPNSGEVQKLETIDGFSATELQWFADLMSANVARAHELMNVRYIVSPKDLPIRRVFEADGLKVYESDCLPRTWIVNRIRSASSNAQAITMVKDKDTDLLHEALLQSPIDDEIAPLLKSGPSELEQPPRAEPRFAWRGPNKFIVDVDVTRSSLLVVSEMWYPGWEAQSSGRKLKVVRVDGGVMGVLIPAGSNRVEFRFRPMFLNLQLIITTIAVLTLLLALARGEGKSCWGWDLLRIRAAPFRQLRRIHDLSGGDSQAEF